MLEHVCKNENCKKAYQVTDNDADDGYCSFDCWEEDNCRIPEAIPSEEFVD